MRSLINRWIKIDYNWRTDRQIIKMGDNWLSIAWDVGDSDLEWTYRTIEFGRWELQPMRRPIDWKLDEGRHQTGWPRYAPNWQIARTLHQLSGNGLTVEQFEQQYLRPIAVSKVLSETWDSVDGTEAMAAVDRIAEQLGLRYD